MVTKKAKFVPTTTTVGDAINTCQGEFEALKEEYENWYDNMPEGIQGGSKGDEIQECMRAIDEVVDALDTILGDIESSLSELPCVVNVPSHPKSFYMSRATRGNEAQLYVDAARDALTNAKDAAEEALDGKDAPDDAPDYDTPIDALEEAISNMDNIEYPTR